MEYATPITPPKAIEVPDNASFIWRAGKWWMQADSASVLTKTSKQVSIALDALKKTGHLREGEGGLFRFSNLAYRPVTNADESPLLRLALMKSSNGKFFLDAEQVRAGERLRVDFERAQLSQRVTMSYEAQSESGRNQSRFSDNHIDNLSDLALTARENLHTALDAVGPELSGILFQVCCLAGGLEQAELQLNLPRRAGKAVLQLALTRLARHYGFKKPLRHRGPSDIGHWATADFRPQISRLGPHQP
jgi:hypothetical protein